MHRVNQRERLIPSAGLTSWSVNRSNITGWKMAKLAESEDV